MHNISNNDEPVPCTGKGHIQVVRVVDETSLSCEILFIMFDLSDCAIHLCNVPNDNEPVPHTGEGHIQSVCIINETCMACDDEIEDDDRRLSPLVTIDLSDANVVVVDGGEFNLNSLEYMQFSLSYFHLLIAEFIGQRLQ